MNTRIAGLIAGFAAAGMVLVGCGESDPHTGHDHDHDGHADHADHGEHDEGGHDDGHGDMRSLGDVTIAGSTLAIELGGELIAGTELHVNIEHKEGDVPTAVRAWVGDEAGTGAIKSKADGADGVFHGHVEVPAELADGAKLWLEIEDTAGERHTGSVAMD